MTPEFLSNHNMIICLTVFLKVKDNEFVILIKRHNLGWFLLWMKALLTLFYQLSKTITKERNICLKMIKFQQERSWLNDLFPLPSSNCPTYFSGKYEVGKLFLNCWQRYLLLRYLTARRTIQIHMLYLCYTFMLK